MFMSIPPEGQPELAESPRKPMRDPAMLTEAVVRESLREEVLARLPELSETIYEFWVPLTNERADVVAIGTSLWAFEIKTHRDNLARLPRQVAAYSRLFDRF